MANAVKVTVTYDDGSIKELDKTLLGNDLYEMLHAALKLCRDLGMADICSMENNGHSD